MSIEGYKSEAAREAREAAANVRRIVREFGDPSSGDYQDPFFEYPTSFVPDRKPGGERFDATLQPPTPMKIGEVFEV